MRPACVIHGEYPETQYNYFVFGAGYTDGEGVEREWAAKNPCTAAAKEMGPGQRRDDV
ncbi:hypothetical protein C8R43DRAFT_886200 [Mycena crocata]|nr:hypothetical protein C8R43DRAFT_886200 [Mycena crocata]